MKYLTIFIYFLLILFIQIEQQQAVPTLLSSAEDTQNYPSRWYDAINEIEENRQQHPLYRYYKRFIDDLLLPERQRRFGNTKYGRSLPNE